MVKHVHLVQVIVEHVHPLLPIVEMGHVTTEKIVDLVRMIALGHIRVTTVLLQTGKHPLGWNVVIYVGQLQHGPQVMIEVVVAPSRILQSLLHIIMVLTFHHVHVHPHLPDPIVVMEHAMGQRHVELVQVIVAHALPRPTQEQGRRPIPQLKHPLELALLLKHRPIRPVKRPLALELHPIRPVKHHPIHLLKPLLEQEPRLIQRHKHLLGLKRHPIHPVKRRPIRRLPHPALQKLSHRLPVAHLRALQLRQAVLLLLRQAAPLLLRQAQALPVAQLRAL